MKHHDLEFCVASVPCPEGGIRNVILGFSSDGRLWFDPRELGIGPQHAEKLARFAGGLYLLINPVTRQVMLNAHAALEVMDNPEDRRRWVAFIESVQAEHKKLCSQSESTRNN